MEGYMLPKSCTKRSHHRFPILCHVDAKVYLRILTYRGAEEIEARLQDISAGGLALRLSRPLHERRNVYVQVTLPDNLCIPGHGRIKHVKKNKLKEYIIGIEFIDLAPEVKKILNDISDTYIECANRIKGGLKFKCTSQCPAHSICSRAKKIK